ncbi:hypothetical protein T4B_12575 [Trichinella pseudospiralis]|uniref:Uncharacterized protein n=1 Tax=Trichinella pseudospiralis TaxID=6337 RepID=A0A0V1IF13_TRIPS|nr:hypothetical protein T4B_12575 [Trichinella pseudospiralis]
METNLFSQIMKQRKNKNSDDSSFKIPWTPRNRSKENKRHVLLFVSTDSEDWAWVLRISDFN